MAEEEGNGRRVLEATACFAGGPDGLSRHVRLTIENGLIARLEPGEPSSPRRTFVLPALVNAHDHARPTASSFGALNLPLETWILRSALGTPVDPYLQAAASLARAVRSGCAAMMVSLHPAKRVDARSR